MTTIKATIKGRRLELDVPADWPDGIEVEIHPLDLAGNAAGPPMDRESWLRFIERTAGSITDPTFERHPIEDAMSAEEIARTLAAMDLVEPLDLTESEVAAWEAERKARIESEKAQFAEHAEELRRQWK
jgi:hypothetical protein